MPPVDADEAVVILAVVAACAAFFAVIVLTTGGSLAAFGGPAQWPIITAIISAVGAVVIKFRR